MVCPPTPKAVCQKDLTARISGNELHSPPPGVRAGWWRSQVGSEDMIIHQTGLLIHRAIISDA